MVPGRADDRPRRATIHEDRGIDRKSESEMGDEPVLADLDAVGETALDHVPTERALAEAEQQNAGERRSPARRGSCRRSEKPDKGHGIGDPDQPA